MQNVPNSVNGLFAITKHISSIDIKASLYNLFYKPNLRTLMRYTQAMSNVFAYITFVFPQG